MFLEFAGLANGSTILTCHRRDAICAKGVDLLNLVFTVALGDQQGPVAATKSFVDAG